MTGYTVHSGSNDKFADGWDRIFGGDDPPRKKKAAKAKTKSAKTRTAKAAKKKSKRKSKGSS